MSIVFDGYGAWVLNDGREEEDNGHKPDGARDNLPAARVVETYAVDAVDEPAANRDGLFGAFRRTTNELAAHVYAIMDATPDIEEQIAKFIETGGIKARWFDLSQEYDIDEEKYVYITKKDGYIQSIYTNQRSADIGTRGPRYPHGRSKHII